MHLQRKLERTEKEKDKLKKLLEHHTEIGKNLNRCFVHDLQSAIKLLLFVLKETTSESDDRPTCRISELAGSCGCSNSLLTVSFFPRRVKAKTLVDVYVLIRIPYKQRSSSVSAIRPIVVTLGSE